MVHLPWTNNVIYWDFGNATDGSGRVNTGALTWTSGLVESFVLTAGSRGREIWRNGTRMVNSAGATATRPTPSPARNFHLGPRDAYPDGTGNEETIYFYALLTEEWDGSKIVEWSENPYQAFRPAIRRTYFSSVVSGFQPAWAVNANTIIQQGRA